MSGEAPLPQSLCAAACQVINEPHPAVKVELTRAFCEAWQTGEIAAIGQQLPPVRPGRPARPELMHPKHMPKRKKGGRAGKLAFLHAIAHIELNAIDLAWDIVYRFTSDDMPSAFYDDWVSVALDEAEHFHMLVNRLADLGGDYGDLPAHDGLWEAALTTADDLVARLALVPMILEARGLDTTPPAVERLRKANDFESAAVLQQIGDEEIPHVAAGVRWFEYLCERRGLQAVPTFHHIVETRFAGQLKPPFNLGARTRAGMAQAYYLSAPA